MDKMTNDDDEWMDGWMDGDDDKMAVIITTNL